MSDGVTVSHMAIRTPSVLELSVYDRALDGQLIPLLHQWRAETPPASAVEISFRLRADHDLKVSHHVVNRWLRELGLLGAK